MIGENLDGRYHVLSLLGSGRCGQTYLAEDIKFEPKIRCVIKQFEPEAKDPLSLRKAKYLFAREIKILKILSKSDRIPNLISYFRQGEKFYLVHEYVEGNDLAQELGDRQWPAKEILNLLREILEIVEVAHREKVIHQDIKPTNIIRRKSDQKLMLIDFGSVKKINNQMANAEGKTSLTVPIGTNGYMAPEQKSIRPRLASDVYSVGMIGIYAVTGVTPEKIPIDHDTEKVQWHNLSQSEPELTEILDSMVSPDFNQRYSSATEALKTVRNFKLGGNLTDLKTIIGTGILLLIILGGGFYYWKLERSLKKNTETGMFEQDKTQFPFLYRDVDSGIEMKYPSNWSITKSQEGKDLVASLVPQQGESLLNTPEVKIEVSQFLALPPLEKYTTDAVYQITQLPKTKIIDSRPITFAGGAGHQVVFTQVSPENNLEQKYLQVWTLQGDRSYKVTYHASLVEYPKFIEIVEQEMLKSVKINPQPKAVE